ncbi:restriction endonuclease [Corynebacterium urealyticum]|uniref:restriction endonuclease n=1 Tax=Corynebacterium urealyticum TaxID=43771 RepID=UPI0011E6090C|nr:restriction endonuclease [Corynebacterium urealyticum]TYR18626.1 restriction endonuclease [Corynebacterium urealyticum]
MKARTWDEFLTPCLSVLADGEIRRRRDALLAAADIMEISDEERAVTISSGEARYLNRGNWAITHLSNAEAISSPARGLWQITDKGRGLLEKYPAGITEAQLRSESGETYQQFRSYVPSKVNSSVVRAEFEQTESELTPLEQVEDGQRRNEEMVAEELLRRLHEREPAFFEQAVLDLLMAMGYGGSFGNATRTQLSNDGGIDGVIDQDALGLSRIYVQAKRYEMSKSIGRPDVQAFVGALHGAQASQGVFLTTASFSSGAINYAGSVQSRVVLIDGALLAKLMIKYGVGVQAKRTVQIVEIDEDYFE